MQGGGGGGGYSGHPLRVGHSRRLKLLAAEHEQSPHSRNANDDLACEGPRATSDAGETFDLSSVSRQGKAGGAVLAIERLRHY